MGARGGRSSLGELSPSKFPDWAAAEKRQTFVFSFFPLLTPASQSGAEIELLWLNKAIESDTSSQKSVFQSAVVRFSSRSTSATSKEELTCLDRYQAGVFDLALNIPESPPPPPLPVVELAWLFKNNNLFLRDWQWTSLRAVWEVS